VCFHGNVYASQCKCQVIYQIYRYHTIENHFFRKKKRFYKILKTGKETVFICFSIVLSNPKEFSVYNLTHMNVQYK